MGLSAVTDKTEKSPLRAIKKTRIYEEIISQITELIAQGKLTSGDQLPSERELCETFRVSRASVREAIRGLESMGLVTSRPGEGTFVSAASVESLIQPMASVLFQAKDRQIELFETRRLLEPPLASLAAERSTPEDIHRLEEVLAKQDAEIAAGETGVESDTAFHMAIASAAKNTILMGLMTTIVDLLFLSRAKSLQGRDRPRKSLAKHREILAAIASGDPAWAERVMREHIESVQENVFGSRTTAAAPNVMGG